MKLSDYVIRFIADQGVKHVFLVTGGGAMHLNESLGRCTEIEAICNSHEQASAMAAEIYGKATNHLGVAMVTTGPGGTNAITGVAGAWLDSTPCLFVSGQVKRPDRMFDAEGKPLGMRQLGVQEVDIVSIVRPITKYAVTVLDPSTIRYHLEKAVHLAAQGGRGPCGSISRSTCRPSLIDPDTLSGFDPAESTTVSDDADSGAGRRHHRGAEPIDPAPAVRRQRHPPGARRREFAEANPTPERPRRRDVVRR